MAETRSTYFGFPRYSDDNDEAVTRTDWEEMVTRAEDRVAFDDGATADTLPATLLKPGRYFRQSFADGYALHRRSAAGAWEWMGGTIQPVRTRMRSTTASDIMLSSDTGGAATATWKASGEFATAAPLRSSSVGVFGAALDADVSVPGTTGRAYVRTVNNGDRGLVVAAHDDAAGALFTARTAGGSDPLTIDSRGRLRASAPIGFGASSPAATVPVAISPTASDVTALDLIARPGDTPVPALRLFRASDDASPIGQVLPESITLGRSSWSGGSITLRAPAVGITGAASVTGTLATSEQATFAKGVSAEAAKLTSYTSGGTSGWRSTVRNAAGTSLDNRDMRQPITWRKRLININVAVSSVSVTALQSFDITPANSCYLDINMSLFMQAAGPGASGQPIEPVNCSMGYRILSADGETTHFSSDQIYTLTLGAFDTWDRAGWGQLAINDVCPYLMNAGTAYRFEIFGQRTEGSAVSAVLKSIVGSIKESIYMGAW